MSERGKPRIAVKHPKFGTCLSCRQGVKLSSNTGAPETHHIKRVVDGGNRLESTICRGSGRQGAYEEYEMRYRLARAAANQQEDTR